MLNWMTDILENLNKEFQIVILIICFAVGLYLLVKGSDIFIDGASKIASKLGIPTFIIGLTIVGFGTSAPEAAVSISSAINKSADVAVGNVVGSNIFNLLFILGLVICFTVLKIKKDTIIQGIIMLVSSLILLIFALLWHLNGSYGLVRIESAILFIGIIVYVIFSIKSIKKDPTQDTQEIEAKNKNFSYFKSITFLLIGLFLIIFGGEVVSYSAKNIALKIGISEALVGLTIVAVGTSLPELVTSIIAIKKGENDLALGNIIGSNIFNILFILGLTGIITPLVINSKIMIDIIFMCAIFGGFLLLCLFKKKIERKYGIIMVCLYVGYITYLIIRDLSLL